MKNVMTEIKEDATRNALELKMDTLALKIRIHQYVPRLKTIKLNIFKAQFNLLKQ